MGKVENRLRATKAALSALLRPRRDCSLSMYLLLLELYTDGELSAMAIERRLKLAGMANPRQLFCEGLAHRWLAYTEDADGKRWRLTGEGQAVVAGLLCRMSCRKGLEGDGGAE